MATKKGAAKPAAPSSSNGTKAKSRAKAAVEEVVDPQPKVAEFQGLTLDLDAELPNTFMWDAAEAADNDMAFYQLVQSLLKPEQRPVVRELLAGAEEGPLAFMQGLCDAILSAYGLGLGESSASQES